MNEAMNEVLIVAGIFAALGALVGALLAIASKAFAVPVNEKAEAVTELLPGANCGGCGYSGCAALAEAIVAGEAKTNACAVGGEACAKQIAALLGVEAESLERMHAMVMCSGCGDVSKHKFVYEGVHDCKAAMQLGGGSKTCQSGCLGLGTCASKCPFGAITVIDRVATIDKEKCKACGLCVESCPKHIIKMVPYNAKYAVECVGTDKPVAKKAYCDVSCIGCKICEKNCESGAITVTNFVASIDYTKCTNCGVCVAKCPRKIIKLK